MHLLQAYSYSINTALNNTYTYVCAAATKSHQSCLTLSDRIDGSPPGSPIPGILQTRTLEWVAISFSNAWKWKVKVKSLRRVRLLATPWTAATRLLWPWDIPGKWVAIAFSICVWVWSKKKRKLICQNMHKEVSHHNVLAPDLREDLCVKSVREQVQRTSEILATHNV